MPLDEEEKRTLAEKLEEQRRAIWRGESVKSKEKKASRPNRTVSFENIPSDSEPESQEGIPLDWGTHQGEDDDVVFTRIPTRIIEAEFTPEEEDQQQKAPEVPSEDTVLELEIPQVGGRMKEDDAEMVPNNRASSLDEAKQSAAAETTSEAGINLKWRLQDDETKQLVDKIKAQREEVWVGESSPKRRRRLKRKTKKSEREFWNPESGESGKSPKRGLSWGGTFIVVFGIISAILLGVLLGFVIAS